MRNAETAKMLVNFFNMQAGTRYRLNDEQENRRTTAIDDAIDRCNGNIANLKEHIKAYVTGTSEEDYNLRICFDTYIGCEPANEVIPSTASEVPTGNDVVNSLGILERALMVAIREQSIPQIEADIKNECTKLLQDFIKKEYGTIERKVVTVVDGEKKEMDGFVHEMFGEVLSYVANDEPVYLYGPAGSGKNHLCKQVADALGLKFYFTNAVTQEYKLTGFTDANGKYQPTQFYQAFKNGGLFMLDEMDASIPETLTILNAAIANRYFDFPAPIGFVKAHKDFRIIAAGNTLGLGADSEYVGRNRLDGASLDRFAPVPIDYCKEIEDGIANDIELADFCRDFRSISKKNGIQVIVSYRAISRLAKMTQLLPLESALRSGIVKGLEKDDLNIICNELHDSKYRTALKNLMATM